MLTPDSPHIRGGAGTVIFTAAMLLIIQIWGEDVITSRIWRTRAISLICYDAAFINW